MQTGCWLTRTIVRWSLRFVVAVPLLGFVAAAAETAPVSGADRSTQQNPNTLRDAWITSDEINRLPQQLRDAIEHDPFTFFRRVNGVWNERVCAAFAAEDQ